MNDFNILITDARVASVEFLLNDDGKRLDWVVNAHLCTFDGRKVTSVAMRSNAWSEEDKIKLPDSLLPIVRRCFETAAPIISDKIMNRFIALPETAVGSST